jgi:type IV secretion system protein VirB10
MQSPVRIGLLVAAFLTGSHAAAAQEAAPPAQSPPEVKKEAAAEPAAKPPAKKIVVPAGTRVPLVVHNSISTRNAKAGDAIYLETTFPIVQDGRVVIPAGSYVSGEVISATRPGRVKSRAELQVRLTTLILENGYAVRLDAFPTGADTGANDTVEEEGKIKGDSSKGADVGQVIRSTGTGAGTGSLIGLAAGNAGRGAAIGGAAGAAIGLMTVLFSRGQELVVPRGSVLDIQLDRPLYLDADKINFTAPGRSTVLSGPSNRRPSSTGIPF